MSKVSRTLMIVVGVILVLLLVLGLVWRVFTRRAFPKTNGTLEVDGLDAEVEIYRDSYGVAHVYAETPADLFFAQGYVHAQERFWQMEFQRRTGSARLSEYFGESTLGVDKFLRTFGFRDLASQAYDRLDDESKLVLDSYAAGVNAYIKDRKPAELGLEFALLELQGVEFDIEPWTGLDSLVWAEMMIYDQGDVLPGEFKNAQMVLSMGSELASDLVPPYRQDRPVIVPTAELDYLDVDTTTALSTQMSADEMSAFSDLLEEIAASPIPAQVAEFGFGQNGGSNSWVISGDLTDTGMPYLANDPHMGVQIPSIWYEIGLHCAETTEECDYQLRGYSLPGVPGLLIGHNDHIAWGMTNAGFDAEDIYVERINPENPNQYEVNGEWVDMDVRYEEIQVKGWDEPYILKVRSTRNGILTTDTLTDNGFGFDSTAESPEFLAFAFQWTALEPVDSVKAIMMLNRAHNYDEFHEALRYFDAGKQTFVYADIEGNIGFQYTGKIPIRANGVGNLPMPGWNDDFQWIDFIPYDDLPRAYNPAQGYIATANHAPARPEDYPYLLTTSFDYGQRAQRINDLIQADTDGISIDDIRAIQTDTVSIPALEYIPFLEKLSFDDPAVSEARDRLVAWDGNHLMDSPEAALFSLFWKELLYDTYQDQFPDGFKPRGGTTDHDIFYWLMQDPDHPLWDNVVTSEQETRDDILTAAFERAYVTGVEQLGDNMDDWQWGDLHFITFKNGSLGQSGISIIENIFNRGPFPVNGTESVIPKTCWSAANDDFHVTCIPSMRQIIDLSDLDNSLMIQSVGQSGHPGHKHYDDFIDLWRTFEYHPTNWLRASVETNSKEHLILKPAE